MFSQKIPSLCLLIGRIFSVPKNCRSLQFKLGFLCLITNVPIGIGGVAICTTLYSQTTNPRYALLGSGIYLFSWLLLTMGILLTGKLFAQQLRKNTRRKFLAWKRLRNFYRK